MKASRRVPSSQLSSKIVDYVVTKGLTQGEVARMLEVSESFVSLVRSRERSLTLDHIEKLADAFAMPFGAFLSAATPLKPNATERQKEIHALVEELSIKADRAIGLTRDEIRDKRGKKGSEQAV